MHIHVFQGIEAQFGVLPDILTVVFFFLKTDLIRAFYAGALPSFAECKQLRKFWCDSNQFTGELIDWRVFSTDRSVVPT